MKYTFIYYVRLILVFVFLAQSSRVEAQTITFSGGENSTIDSGSLSNPCGDVTGASVGSPCLLNGGPVTVSVPSSTPVLSMSFLVGSIGYPGGTETHSFDAQGITNEVVSVASSCSNLITISGNTVSNKGNVSVFTRVRVSSVTPFNTVVITRTTPGSLSIISNSTVVVTCAAGSTAPAPSAFNITNNCASSNSTVNLNSLITTIPANAFLKWYSDTTRNNEVYKPTTLSTSGTYYAFFHDPINDCYSPASAAVAVGVNPCPPLQISNDCTSASPKTVDLAGRLQDVPPPNSVLTFHTATPAITENKLTSSIVTTSGTYYGAYYFDGDGSYTATSRPMVVTITNCCAIIRPMLN